MNVIVEKSRRKTLVLTVTREGGVVVKAPLGASDAEIEAFVARHKRWLARRLSEREISAPKLENGAALMLFGQEYPIAEGRARIQGGVLFLPAENREAALAGLLKRFSAAHMAQLTRRIAERYGFSYASVRITSARTRWGSCGKKGNISYTFRTAFLPEAAAEYIAVHELCHTRRFDHSPAFWQEVSRILPDYPARRKLVRSYEWAMKIL